MKTGLGVNHGGHVRVLISYFGPVAQKSSALDCHSRMSGVRVSSGSLFGSIAQSVERLSVK